MKQNEKISSSLGIEKIVKKTKTVIYLYVKGERTLLFAMPTSEYLWLNYVYDENYIVVYSRGCMVNQIPLKVEIAYDIKNNKIFNVSRKNEKLFEYMYIFQKGFDISVVIQYLNGKDLQIVSAYELEDFERYITGGNCEISKEKIVDYIIEQYPVLKEYVNFSSPLSVKQYREIVDDIAIETIRFHIMPQQLKQE